MSHSLKHRPITLIEFGDKTLESIYPSSVVLADANIATNGRRYLDFGSLCYARRAKRSGINRYIKYEGIKVDPITLAIDRVELVRKLIEVARSMQSFASAIGLYTTSRCFFDWIDTQDRSYVCDETDSMREAYINYSASLLERINVSGIRGKPIKPSTASQLQSAARQTVSLSTGLHEKELKVLAPLIMQSNRGEHVNLNQPSSDTQSRTFATLINFVEEAHRILIDGGRFPMKLASPGSEPYYLYSMLQGTTKSLNAKFSIMEMLSKSATFPAWDYIKNHFKLSGPDWKYFHCKSNSDTVRQRHESSNSDLRCALRFQIANHAMTAGMLSFIAATGGNLSVVQDLDIDHLEIVPSTQGRRLYGAKPRANGRTVAPEFGARFTPIFKKILQIRTWILNGKDSKLVFPILPKGSSNIGYVGTSALGTLRALFRKTHPGITWVPPVQWRKNVSYEYLTSSGGDAVMTAEKLSNTPQTLKKSYARPALDEFAIQVSELLNAIHKAAIARTRHVNLIPVHVKELKSQQKVTGVGSCEKTSEVEPLLAAGFTREAPQPNCRDPETCLFCDFYAVHADEEDIRRLLSLRYIIHKIKAQHTHDHWQEKFAPTSHRIDEVLTAVVSEYGPLAGTVDRVRCEVEAGDMDPFWAIHFDTMVYIGAVV